MTSEKSGYGILGIDAGGTFTDLAFISSEDSSVVAWGKTPTLHNDLIKTIESGLKIILGQIEPERIKGINLATTLATNAIVENKIRATGLILIGYDETQVNQAIAANKFGTQRILMIGGGHDPKGNEAAPLDEEKLEKNIDMMIDSVESIAVSGYFSVRNPSHEVRVCNIIKKRTSSIYVTCGHELASDLDAILRATTATLNAGLIPIVIDLFKSVDNTFKKYGINVPISIVRSDGTLVGVDWANEHPIETVLSGPAASSIGACHLANAKNFGRPTWVVDIGGTTTDIIYLDENGKPGLGTEGTTIGRHKTLIRSIDIHTFGLGGDSRIQFDKDMKLLVGPRRVKPLCSFASEINEVYRALQHLDNIRTVFEPLVLTLGTNKNTETEFEKKVIDKIGNAFTTPDLALEGERLPFMSYLQLGEMEDKGLIAFSGFTPTDALHVIGKLDKWNANASKLGAKILSKGRLGIDKLSEDVCDEVVRKIALNILMKSVSRTYKNIDVYGEFETIVNMGLVKVIPTGAPSINYKLNAALIGVGAPAWAFIDEVGKLLGEKAYQPENAGIAGAVGAAVGTFSLRYSVWITPMANGNYRAHLPLGIEDYETLEEAVENAVKFMKPWIEDRAKRVGAALPKVEYKQEDETAWIQGGLRKIHLWTQLWFTVVDENESEHN